MAFDNETLGRIREALDAADHVDAERIDLTTEDGTIVLEGTVASHEAASAAALVVEQQAGRVINHLAVDAHLREGTHVGDGAPPSQDRSSDSDGTSMVADSARALGENEPWDPPDAPYLAPSAAEQRGYTERKTDSGAAADDGDGR